MFDHSELDRKIQTGDNGAIRAGIISVAGIATALITRGFEHNNVNQFFERLGIIVALEGIGGAAAWLDYSQRAIEKKERILFELKRIRTRSPEDQTKTE